MRAAALAIVGALGLAVTAAFRWFGYDPEPCGWTCYSLPAFTDTRAPLHVSGDALGGLGLLAAVALVLCVLAALAAAALMLREGPRARRPLTALLALDVAATAILAVRVVTQPGLGRGEANRFVDVTPAAGIGLSFALLSLLGVALAWRASRRTTAPPLLS
ncbi:MAG: hypothetical protein JWQ18_2018 [Conexibacter sp.]|nr:hypothetical protein [Conexibacter sp.]